MILLALSADQAKHIAERIEDPALLDAICRQLRFEELFVDLEEAEPLMVMFKNTGQGLALAAITYYDAKAAESAEDRFWSRVLDEAQRLPLFADQRSA